MLDANTGGWRGLLADIFVGLVLVQLREKPPYSELGADLLLAVDIH
jgi:hypothetical protein